jgi:hypothetical protein
MSVEQSFVQWYQQLSQTDQQMLSNFIMQNFCISATSKKTISPRFGGRQVGPVGSVSSNSMRFECPYCHKQIEIG